MTHHKSSAQQAREFNEALIIANPEMHKEQQALRAKIVARMREIGVKTLSCEYEGSCDDGHISNIKFDQVPNEDEPTKDIIAYMFIVVSQHFPGYEIDWGSDGTITWNITTDKIKVEHAQNIPVTTRTTRTNL